MENILEINKRRAFDKDVGVGKKFKINKPKGLSLFRTIEYASMMEAR